jgi:hypothetical protein
VGQLADLIVSNSDVFWVHLRGPRLSLPLVSQAQSYKLCSCFWRIGILDRRHVDALLAANHFVDDPCGQYHAGTAWPKPGLFAEGGVTEDIRGELSTLHGEGLRVRRFASDP